MKLRVYEESQLRFFPNKSTGLFAENLRQVFDKIDSTPEISTLCAIAYYTVIVFLTKC